MKYRKLDVRIRQPLSLLEATQVVQAYVETKAKLAKDSVRECHLIMRYDGTWDAKVTCLKKGSK